MLLMLFFALGLHGVSEEEQGRGKSSSVRSRRCAGGYCPGKKNPSVKLLDSVECTLYESMNLIFANAAFLCLKHPSIPEFIFESYSSLP